MIDTCLKNIAEHSLVGGLIGGAYGTFPMSDMAYRLPTIISMLVNNNSVAWQDLDEARHTRQQYAFSPCQIDNISAAAQTKKSLGELEKVVRPIVTSDPQCHQPPPYMTGRAAVTLINEKMQNSSQKFHFDF